MDATPPSLPPVTDFAKWFAGGAGAVLAAWKLIRRHISGQKVGQVYEHQRKDGREGRVIPRPEAAELLTARQDVRAMRAGLQRLESEMRRIDTKVDDNAKRAAERADRDEEARERDRAKNDERLGDLEHKILERVDANHSATQTDVKALIAVVGNLTGEVRTLVQFQLKAGD